MISYSKVGIAASALSEHYHRMKKLLATHMTGGGNELYLKSDMDREFAETIEKN